ncbi:hypothetical protein DMENIID0001_015590 [Sergentomyia squamirostris]
MENNKEKWNKLATKLKYTQSQAGRQPGNHGIVKCSRHPRQDPKPNTAQKLKNKKRRMISKNIGCRRERIDLSHKCITRQWRMTENSTIFISSPRFHELFDHRLFGHSSSTAVCTQCLHGPDEFSHRPILQNNNPEKKSIALSMNHHPLAHAEKLDSMMRHSCTVEMDNLRIRVNFSPHNLQSPQSQHQREKKQTYNLTIFTRYHGKDSIESADNMEWTKKETEINSSPIFGRF